jgi:two-component system, NarL family, response regulator LiaR
MFPLRALVADDHRMFRQGLIGLMNTRRDLVEVVAEASTGREAVLLAQFHRPDVVLLDIRMPDGDGLEALTQIRSISPQTAVVIVTASELNGHVLEATRLGAAGYLLKSLDAAELFDLLISIGHGQSGITRATAARLLRVINQSAPPQESNTELTEREMDVLRLVAQGQSNQQIAQQLSVSINTIKTHMRSILSKLQLDNRTQIATYAVHSGLMPNQPDDRTGDDASPATHIP